MEELDLEIFVPNSLHCIAQSDVIVSSLGWFFDTGHVGVTYIEIC
jgi:hypothetical protein